MCSPFPNRLFFPAVAGGPTWPEGKACTHHSNGMATCSPATVVSENRHNRASISRTPQDNMHTCARHAHIAMHSAKQHCEPGMQYRASRALGTSRSIHAERSCRPCRGTAALDLRTQVRANAWPPPYQPYRKFCRLERQPLTSTVSRRRPAPSSARVYQSLQVPRSGGRAVAFAGACPPRGTCVLRRSGSSRAFHRALRARDSWPRRLARPLHASGPSSFQ